MKIRDFTHRIRGRFIIGALNNVIDKDSIVLDYGYGNGLISSIIKNKSKCNVWVTDCEKSSECSLPFLSLTTLQERVWHDFFDCVLLIDTLHHIPKNKQEETLKFAKSLGRKVFVFETAPSIGAYCIDFINSLSGMPTPYAFRTPNEIMFIVDDIPEIVETPWWYPLKHYSVILEKKNG